MPRIDADDPIQSNGRERLAVNLADLDRVDPTIRGILLGGKLDATRAVVTDKGRMDEIAVAFTCDLLTAACCCDTLRTHDRKVGDYPTRVYVFRRAWTKIVSSALLTLIEGDKVVLNPALFDVDEIEPGTPTPPKPGRKFKF